MLPPGTPLQIRNVQPKVSSVEFVLASLGWAASERTAQVATMEASLQQGQAAGVLLLAAYRNDVPVAALLAHSLPGRTAAIWPVGMAAGESETTATALFSELHRCLAQSGTTLCQALVPASDDPASGRWRGAGYQQGANLLSMTCEAVNLPTQSPPQADLHFVPTQPGDEGQLSQLVERTYEKTLDCPLLNGMRQGSDVLEGYRQGGAFRPELWFQIQRAMDKGRLPIGCLFLMEHPANRNLELVYFGLVPEARGRGLGRQIVQRAMWEARQAGVERLVLAVDATNTPAIDIYSAAGFWVWDERRLWVRSIGDVKS